MRLPISRPVSGRNPWVAPGGRLRLMRGGEKAGTCSSADLTNATASCEPRVHATSVRVPSEMAITRGSCATTRGSCGTEWGGVLATEH